MLLVEVVASPNVSTTAKGTKVVVGSAAKVRILGPRLRPDDDMNRGYHRSTIVVSSSSSSSGGGVATSIIMIHQILLFFRKNIFHKEVFLLVRMQQQQDRDSLLLPS